MKLVLTAQHSEFGASFLEMDGFEVPAAYGGGQDEGSVLRSGCGLIDRSWVSRLELRGADRHRFLNGLVSANVETLVPGENVYGFFTDIQGRVLADVYVIALEDRLWLELPAGQGVKIREHLEKYRVADRVEVCSLEDLLPLTLLGPESDTAARRLGVPSMTLDGNCRATVFGTELHLDRRLLYGIDASTLWVSASIASEVWNQLAAAAGVVPVGVAALEEVRIEGGVGRWGRDFGDEHLPQETGLFEEGVDLEKGCYLGQEIVARLHYKGKPKQLSVAVVIRGGEQPPDRAQVFVGETAVGALSSVAPSGDDWLGLGILRRKAVEEGHGIRLADGRELEIRPKTSTKR